MVGKVDYSIPRIGRFINFVKTPVGFWLLIVIPTLGIIGSEVLAVIDELRNKSSDTKADFLKPLAMFFMAAIFLGSSHAFFNDVALVNRVSISTATVFPGQPGSVVINEINWAGGGNSEWLELRNMTLQTIDLSNWLIESLGNGSDSVTISSGSISPNGFFLIANSDKDASGASFNVDPDFATTGLSLDNGGEQLILKNSIGGVVDIANGTSRWFAGVTSNPNKSMERKNPPGDGAVSTNWNDASTHTNMDGSTVNDDFGTPKAENGL